MEPRPLSGVRVVDLTAMLAGPFASMIIGDLGADVIKIEPPAGDFTRGQGPFTDDDHVRAFGGYFQSVNRNKRSVVLDLRTDEGRDHVLDLIATADVVMENFRNGVMERLGLAYENLREINPRLVYAAIRGFGDARTGDSPLADWPAYDLTAQAMGAVMATTGEPGGPPTKVGPGIGDIVPALFMASGLLAALVKAERTGRGSFVDVAMYDAMVALCERQVYQYSYTGVAPGRDGNSHPLLSPFDVLRARDGWVTIAAPTDPHWRTLCALIGRNDLIDTDATGTAPARARHSDYVHRELEAWTIQRGRDEIIALLGGRIPVGAVNSIDDVFDDPHIRARRMLQEVPQAGGARPVVIAGTPIKFLDTPDGPPRRAPLLGEHTDEVLADTPRRPQPVSGGDRVS